MAKPPKSVKSKLKGGKYKTEECLAWTVKGTCKYGKKCRFAHGQDEIRKIKHHKRYRTIKCEKWENEMFCCYGKRCRFLHNPTVSIMTTWILFMVAPLTLEESSTYAPHPKSRLTHWTSPVSDQDDMYELFQD